MSAQKDLVANYLTVQVEAAENGWIVKAKHLPAKVFVRWESVVKYMESLLVTRQYPEA